MKPADNLSDKRLIETYNILGSAGKILSINYILDELTKKGLFTSTSITKSRYLILIAEHPEYFFSQLAHGYGAIGLNKWIPYRKKPKKRVNTEKYNIEIKKPTKKDLSITQPELQTFKHVLTGDEIKEGYLSISPKLLVLYPYTGSGFLLNAYCYGDYSFNVWVNSEYLSLHAPEIAEFYKSNKLKKGDLLYLEKRAYDPNGVHLYTTWQFEALSKKSAADTPEYPRHKKSKVKGKGEKISSDLKNSEYLLSLVQKEDLVYKYLKHNGPSYPYEISKAIAKTLGIKKKMLDKLTFIDFSDRRLIRRGDGRIGLVITEGTDTVTEKPEKQSKINNTNKVIYYVIILSIVLFVMLAIYLLLFL